MKNAALAENKDDASDGEGGATGNVVFDPSRYGQACADVLKQVRDKIHEREVRRKVKE